MRQQWKDSITVAICIKILVGSLHIIPIMKISSYQRLHISEHLDCIEFYFNKRRN
jgi:hypothetical protein